MRAPSLAGAFARPRLTALAGDAPVVTISGPTGSGVTTAAAAIAATHVEPAAESGASVAWIRLAPGYDTAADVVAGAAATFDPDGNATPPSARVVDLAEHLLTMIDDEIDRAGGAAVVVDDHDLAADGDVDRLLAEVAQAVQDGVQLVIAGSIRPAGLLGLVPVPIVRSLDATDLAFTLDETVGLFEHHGADAERAAVWHRALEGLAPAMAIGARRPDDDPTDHATDLLAAAGAETHPEVIAALVALPYVTDEMAGALGLPREAVDLLARTSPLVVAHRDAIALTPAARAAATIDAAERHRLVVAAAGVLAASDPTAAIDALIDVEEHGRAADVLAAHLSSIGVERALTWLYRLPAELRHRFPPVLAAGRATVEVDLALADANARLEAATDDRERREALYALGSVERHRGELANAASALEAARRATASGDDALRMSLEIATTRWLLGDTLGARAEATQLTDHIGAAPAELRGEIAWLLAQLDAVDADGHDESSLAADADDTDEASVDVDHHEPYAMAARALRALVRGDLDGADEASRRAYGAAVEDGGEPFVAVGAVRAWTLLRTDRHDDAAAVVDELERRLGPRHHLARLHAALLRVRLSRGGDTGEHERDQRRVRDLRVRGYATIERLAAVALGEPVTVSADPDEPAVVVSVLGSHRAAAPRGTLSRSDWTSKKAFEVLTVLASSGRAGMRREQLIEAVWPGRDPDKGRTLLRRALSDIRKLIEPDRPAGEASRLLEAIEDRLRLDGCLDLDLAERRLDHEPAAAFERLRHGLAPDLVGAGWADDLAPRIERSAVRSAEAVAGSEADATIRIAALEHLVTAEPWQRSHYDALAELHRERGDEAAAADVERRWFADD